jgi:hypothetical protein
MTQFLLLVATAFGVRNHITPATLDGALADLLGIDLGRKQVFYAVTLGCGESAGD